MTDIRIQDFGENLKPDNNNDFVMTFNDSSESKTRLRDAFYSMVPDGAQTHNNIFRGWNLGALNSTQNHYYYLALNFHQNLEFLYPSLFVFIPLSK